MNHVIGLAGYAGSGKDTLADYLVREHGYTKLAWAGPLKAGLAAMGLPEPADRDDKERIVPGFTFTWREAAQRLGTEWGRALDSQIWIKMVVQHIQKAPAGSRFVLSDCRFDNETAAVRAMGGKMLFVIGRRAELGGAAAHASETLPMFRVACDETIDNSGDLAASLEQMRAALEL